MLAFAHINKSLEKGKIIQNCIKFTGMAHIINMKIL